MRGGGLHFHFHLWLVFLFALTVASFGLGVENQSVRCIAVERQALIDFKTGLTVVESRLVSWTSEEEECCNWIGVGCDNSTGNVVKLDLDRMFITGEIGSSLLELKQLSYLDLSFNHFHKIPNFIGSLSDLTYLDLSGNSFTGFIPHQFGNLSRLLYLDLSYNYLWGSIPLSFDNMPDLQRINFEGNNLEGGIPKSLGNICNLKKLNLKDNELSGSLVVVVKNLSGCAKDSLQALILARNQLTGALPDLSILSSFQRSNLRGNNLEGGIPKSLGNICNLKELDLTDNKLSGSLGVVVKNLSGCAKDSLQALLLARNRLTGALHDLSILSSLRKLSLSGNQLERSLPVSIGKMSQLVLLDVSSNSLHGVIFEVHLFNLTKLRALSLSFNSFSFNLRSNWIPPFQLDYIGMRLCSLGPQFPSWLRWKNDISYFDISHSNISDAIPDWFWNLPSSELNYLNLSSNKISGSNPNLPLEFGELLLIDLSSNLFHGPARR